MTEKAKIEIAKNEDKREKHFKLEYHLTFTQTHRAVMLFYFQDMFEICARADSLARSLARVNRMEKKKYITKNTPVHNNKFKERERDSKKAHIFVYLFGLCLFFVLLVFYFSLISTAFCFPV